ncbi:DUF3857 domain-containing protein [Seonamhaeicola marinus]|uniref:DUF3857 domain-containing protein n=1 Tax=Seonamhaeicola marinus TaxID=1912246 RepID=A0A5D0HER0_9FLAO|nr:DUF3857 domain-containing protein [Seonamhaeicola marinus]TYA69858.1 DUF3857 domain-containing protein [Seonamhaeicola marinus]
MHKTCTAVLLLLFTSFVGLSQNNFYSSLTIDDNLKQNANAVVRLSETNVEIKSIDNMVITNKQIITVFNKKGDRSVNSAVYYDNNVKVKEVKAIMYNDFGTVIKKFKKNDFKDVSAVSGGTLYSDARNIYLEYTPIKYPYTLEFTSVVNTSNTAFIPSFSPVENYFLSIEKSKYTISYPENFTIRKKEQCIKGLDIDAKNSDGNITYTLSNVEAFKPESYSPPFRSIIPRVLFASNDFNYEGVKAKVNDWESMGKWFNDNLLKGRTALPAATISEIKSLINEDDSDLEKARKVYQYVQDNTRYISVQVGVGGMQPISASNVDRVKYGDCKGLTNYTKSLLDVVGVKSYYTRLYASPYNRLDVDKDFVSFGGQTNHVILNIPQENSEDIWLECTSQKLPFGFIGDFTDDRDVLVITPEGGKILHTKKYEEDESLQTITATCEIGNDGGLKTEVKVVSEGIQYDNKFWLETETQRDLDTHYKKRWKYINGLSLNEIDVTNNKDAIEFVESLKFNTSSYSKLIGERMLVAVNVLNRDIDIPNRYRTRHLPLQIKRGFKDVDEVEIKLPTNYKIESQPKDVVIENKFGSYKMTITPKDENTIIYKREFIVRDGDFPKEDYTSFRDFYKEVSKKDNAKIALIKK